MEKSRKKTIKRIIAAVCLVAVVAFLASLPLLTKQAPEESGPKASILSGTATTGDIHTELIGGGTLAEETAVSVSVPSAVKLTGFLVSNGDTVTKGTPIASVDRVTVMTAITQVQETLEYLSEQIEEAGDTDSEQEILALAGGTVKLLYATEGESVQKIMLEHGALAVLSLDGLMAVDIETDVSLSAGTAVTVTLSNGETVSGKIAANLLGKMTVTIEDDAYTVGDTVQIFDPDGNNLGSGLLYIYNPWNATAYAGIIDSVDIEAGDKLDAGETLMVLSDVGYSAAYRQLIGQRQEYEELMFTLFKMYQTEILTAPCDGIVSGISKNSVQLLSTNTTGYSVSFLANAPNGDDESLYANYVGMVTELSQDYWTIQINPQPIPIADYLDLSGVSVDPALMTQTVQHTQLTLPIYTIRDGIWVQMENSEIQTGDILLFATDGQGNLVWSVLIVPAQQEPADPSEPPPPLDPSEPIPSEPSFPSEPFPSEPSEPNPSAPTEPGTPSIPGGSTPSIPGGTGTQPNFTYPSTGNGFGTMPEQEPEFELYGLEMAEIAAVTPQNIITLDITIDEHDITALQIGMQAQIQIDALGGEKHTATISSIGNTGTSNGGNSKFTVTLTMDRDENMLSGMNATATITLSTACQILTIPVDALCEQGNQTIVYTGYDTENETLINPVTVRVGVSDGESVEILEGLTAGQTYYYAYYDTLEISFTPDSANRGFLGR